MKISLSLPSSFQDSRIATYARMWQYMEQNNDVWSASNKEGVERVLNSDGQYAFMMESTVVDYVVERQCELTQVGGLLDNKGYGIGLPPSKFSEERAVISKGWRYQTVLSDCLVRTDN